MKVYLAAVTHKHGRNLYAGASKKELLDKLAAYVQLQGGPEEWIGSYKPKSQAEIDAMTDEEVVERYFQDHPTEFVEEDSDEITLPGPRDFGTRKLMMEQLAAANAPIDDSYRPQGTAIEGRAH
ncbi:hypothetical protein IB265_33030 [Ensifer sp. ENS10]|uniref:hypothetical protein n=1 Tax=Ensifer sp. ENS10 TaxID=2769286 RepID=UPI00177E3EB5|nr:hypothetical protein [Ensifer sp. ENS10]MBD9511582.1 hypothetical protein [Ensifer sp. ENS10]